MIGSAGRVMVAVGEIGVEASVAVTVWLIVRVGSMIATVIVGA